MTLPMFDQEVYGCVSRNGYTYSHGEAHSTLSRLKGRARKVLKDIWPIIAFNVNIPMTASQFAGWQMFWKNVADRGNKPFRMRLMIDDLDLFLSGAEIYEVRAMSEWSAAYSPAGIWDVSIQLETPALASLIDIPCDSIYGGPITNLSSDSIYGGPIDNLATDIIAPCPGVQP